MDNFQIYMRIATLHGIFKLYVFFPLPLNEKSETKPYNFKILMLKKMITDASKPVARYFNLPNPSTLARQLAVFPSPRKHREP